MLEKETPKQKDIFVANFKAPGLGQMGIVIALELWADHFETNKKILSNNLVIVAPPIIYLDNMVEKLGSKKIPIAVSSQDVSKFEQGNYTSETTAAMIVEAGATHSIIGHSETRTFEKLTNEDVAGKIEMAEKYNLTPIVCVRTAEEASWSIKDHDFNGLIAYEPVAAIGTGKAASPEEAAEVCNTIKKRYPNARILYGGSVNKDNVIGFIEQTNIDGVLVGQKSVDPKFFADIINTVNDFRINKWLDGNLENISQEEKEQKLKKLLREVKMITHKKQESFHDDSLANLNISGLEEEIKKRLLEIRKNKMANRTNIFTLFV